MDLENTLIKYLNDIEKVIEARAHHEEALQIKEKDVKERREKERRAIEFQLLKLEKLTRKAECCNPGDANIEKQSKEKCLIHFRLLFTLLEDFSKEDFINTCFSGGCQRAFLSLFGKDVEYFAPSQMDSVEKAIAERGLYKRKMQRQKGLVNLIISKDASEIDNNVDEAFHDNDNITDVQSSNNKILENVFAHDHDQQHTAENTKTDHKMLKEENAIACNPKLYDAEVLSQQYVKPDMHDSEEIINDGKESQVKMKEKQFQVNYENINSLYDTFVPQTELSLEQEYFSTPSTSNVSYESSTKMLELPSKKMPNKSKLLQLFVKLEKAISALQLGIDETLLKDRNRTTWKIKKQSRKDKICQNKIDQLLEANIANDVRNLIMPSYVKIKNKEEIERFSKESKDGDKFCNDVVEVKEKLSTQIV
ncbi:hypothetical protein Tco_1128677 [Tanacetum coccineum]